MDTSHFNVEPYLNALESGELILTANSRLRRHILRAYGIHNQNKSNQALKSPRIYSLAQLVDAYWAKLQSLSYEPSCRRIVNTMQRHGLWEFIVHRSPLSSELLQPEALAADADVALTNLDLWLLGENDVVSADFGTNLGFNSSDDKPQIDTYYAGNNTACFLQWRREFIELLDQKQCITETGAVKVIIRAFEEGILAAEPIMRLAGFGQIPPLHSMLLSVMSPQMIAVDNRRNSSTVIRTEVSSVESEIKTAALWSQKILEHAPGSVIGIIVPNLGQCRMQVERIFSEVFEPLAGMPGSKRYTLPFNFSAGTPLGQTPVIAAALDLLDLNKSQWDLEFICNVVLSPFYGSSKDEYVFRTHLITRLRKLGKFTISSADIREHSEYLAKKLSTSHDAEDASAERELASIHEKIRQMESVRKSHAEYNSVTTWCEIFQAQLNAVGWPGARALDSHEHQQVEQWNNLMESFQLNSWDTTMSFASATRLLRNIALKTPFQAKTGHSPIQILGTLESDCLQFSHAWVMGLHHRQWPAAPEPNPLLPVQLQRHFKMPHSSAERELEFAKYLTDNLSHCADNVVFSSARQDEDTELMPSALIRAIPLTPSEVMVDVAVTQSERNLEKVLSHQSLELVDTAFAPALMLNNEPVRGGAAIFKDQSLCPFNAFAKHRLGAIQIDPPVLGFSPSDRGNLVHEALATIWKQINNQQQLCSLSPESLQSLASDATSHAINRMCMKRNINSSSLYARVEKDRLSNLVINWLELEKSRPPFKVVSVEQEVHVKCEGMLIKLRMDRVDQLESGDVIFIDYKTGEPSIRNWEGDRMSEPQLPLYAVTANTKASAIAFAQVSAKSLRWLGTGELQVDHDGIYRGSMPWAEQLESWSQQLRLLAQSFIAGDCRVDVKNTSALRYDEYLLPLNRLPEESAIKRVLESSSQGGK